MDVSRTEGALLFSWLWGGGATHHVHGTRQRKLRGSLVLAPTTVSSSAYREQPSNINDIQLKCY